MNDFYKNPFTSYISNSFTNLSERCAEKILNQPHTTKTYLAYPSNEVKDFFIQSFIKKNSSIFGIRFITIQQFIHLLLKICYKKDLPFPSHYELMFFLEERISSLLSSDDECILPLKEYIADKPDRIIALSSNLSHIFLDYMLYGKGALPSWLNKKSWQTILYQDVSNKWVSIISAIQMCPPPPFPISLHIFGVDEIPALYLSFIEKLSSQLSFSFYFLSPSPVFWGDLISLKKCAYLDKLFRKNNTSLAQRREFATYAENAHPLLAHFCEAGKALYNFLHERDCIEDYNDIEMISDLSYIQKALLYQIKPEPPPFEDGTFSLHAAPSLLREVEIVIVNILSTLKKYPELTPADITVLAPDIDIYYPFISYLFSGNDLPFSYAISNLQMTKHDPLLESLYLLFSLIDSRFEKDEVLKLFNSPYFQRKCQISKDDVLMLEKIINHTGIRWGFNQTSKSAILDNDAACPFGLFEKGFNHMLDLIAEKDSTIEFSEVESIGDMIFLVKSLHEDLSVFKNQHYTLKKWLANTSFLANKYLYLEEDEEDFFFKEIKKITMVAKSSTHPFSFLSFKRLLLEIFSKKGAREKTYQKPPITFSSIESSPPVNKTLFFIGLDEESYPKREPIRSLNELSTHKLYEKKMSPAKKARYYLLKAICSAKTAISFSYTSNNPIDGRARNYCSLIEEMKHALCLKEPIIHPFSPFSATYFQTPNVLEKQYELYKSSKEHPFPAFTFKADELDPLEEKVIECKDLALLARSPSKFFYNLSANLYETSYASTTVFDDSEFILSYLDKSIITKKKIKDDTPSFKDLISINKLPTALFEKAATKEMHLSIETEKKLFLKHFQTTDPYLTLHLDPHIHLPVKKDSTTFIPAIHKRVNGCYYLIKGSIPNLTEKGFISFKSATTSEIWKALPHLILLSHLNTNIPAALNFLNEDETIHFSKEKLQPLLKTLLSYYEKALNDISPLVPEAVEQYQSKNEIAFAEVKAKLLSRFNDPYLEKAEPKNYLHFKDELIEFSSILTKDDV
jgi:exodeoxyribonuclease V gamma subunit